MGRAEAIKLNTEGVLLKPSKSLHMYVRYMEENLLRIFSIDGTPKCTITDKICTSHFDQCSITTDDSYVYCLNYNRCKDPSVLNASALPTFHYYSSVKKHLAMNLKIPPLIFVDAALSPIQNNIYAYHAQPFRFPLKKTDTDNSKTFNDEEINRGIYLYNCNLDTWFPVPSTKKLLQLSCMTVCENMLYLIGGQNANRSSENYSQFYDFRVGIWQALPRSFSTHVGAGCSTMNGKIYVCGGPGKIAELYDPIAGKWDLIAPMSTDACFHSVIPYMGRLWAMGNYKRDYVSTSFICSDDLSIDVYSATSNLWTISSMMTEAAVNTTNPHTVIDNIVL